MVDNFNKPAGTYELMRFFIKPLMSTAENQQGIDIKNLIHTFTINESMKRGYVGGSAKVYDSQGVLYDLPLRGEEVLEITYKDFKNVEHTDKMFIYSINELKPSKTSDSKMLEYEIHFASFGKFISHRKRVREAFNEEVSKAAQSIFDKYYVAEGEGTDKEIYILDTDNIQTIVVPAMRPEDAMHLLSRKAYTQEYSDQTFRFFENRKQYYFTTYEDLIAFDGGSSEIPIYYWNDLPDNTDQLYLMQAIIDINFGETINTFKDMNRGAFYRRLVEVDYINRREIVNEYEHLVESENYIYPHELDGSRHRFIHSKDFIQTHLNEWDYRLVLKDYADIGQSSAPGIRPSTYYGETFPRKGSQFYHYDNSAVTIKVYGSNEIFAGSFISLDLIQFKETRLEKDESYSGVYLVESITNEFINDSYYQTLTLVRSGINDTTTNQNNQTLQAPTSGVGDLINTTPPIDADSTNASRIGEGSDPSASTALGVS